MTQDWDIRPRGEQCAACQTPFTDHQRMISALTMGPEGYDRTDFCEPCWQPETHAGQPFSIWHSTFRLPPPPDAPPLRHETAEDLLRTLMEEGDASRIGVIYILAVMLERKRTLIEREVRRRDDGTLMRIYEHRKTGETFIVTDPQLALHDLEPVQRAVAEILTPPPAPTPVPPPPAPAAPKPAPGDANVTTPAGFKEGFYTRDA